MSEPKTPFRPAFNRTGVIFILGSLIALGPLSIDMYLPGFPDIAKDLDTDIARVGHTLTSYFIGIGIGQLVYGPLMDRYGRKGPMMVGLLLFLLATVGCALAPNVETLIVTRFIMAVGGCAGLVASRAMVRDLFPVDETAKVFSTLMLIMGVAPIIGPSIGGIVVGAWGWRMIFGILIIVSVLVILASIFSLPESRKADKEMSLRLGPVLRNYGKVMRNPAFLTYGMAGSLMMTGLYAYIAGSPFLVMDLMGYSESTYGWIFGVNAGGLIAGSQANRFMLKKYSSETVTFYSGAAAFVVSAVLVIGILTGLLGDIGILTCLFLFLTSLGFVAPNTMALALAPFDKLAGSASALVGTLRMLTGASASWCVSFLHDGTALPLGAIVGIFSTLGFLILLRLAWSKRAAAAVTAAASEP